MKKIFLPLLMLSILLFANCNRNTEQNTTDTTQPTAERSMEERKVQANMSMGERYAQRLESVNLTDEQRAKIDEMFKDVNLREMSKEERKQIMPKINRDIFENVLTPEQQITFRKERTKRREERQNEGGGGGE